MFRRLILTCTAWLLVGTQAFAAISAAMVFEVQTGGNDASNSGGFRGGSFIAAPAAPIVTPSGSGGTVAAATYYVVVTATDGLGESVISGQTPVTTSGATASFTVTAVASYPGALTWSCYVGTTTGGPYWPQGTGLILGSNRVVTTTPPTTGVQPRGVDRSLATGRQLIIDNTTVTATTTGANSNIITFAGYTPTGADVANTARITSGTNINAGVYEITAITTTTWTVSGAANLTTAGGAGSGLVGGMGGCFASPGQACAAAGTIGNIVYVKAGTYTVAGGTANTAGNKFTATQIGIIGYTSNRNPFNTDIPPVLDAGANGMTVMTMSGNFSFTHNISITNSAAHTTVVGWVPSGGTSIGRHISVANCATAVGSGMVGGTLIDCSDSGCGGAAVSNNNLLIRYVSIGNTSGTAISAGNSCYLRECIVTGQSGASTIGINVGNASIISNCVVNGNSSNTTTGIKLAGNNCLCENSIVLGYTGTASIGYGTNATAGASINKWVNCADYNNTIPYDTTIQAAYQKSGCISLGADPFTASGSNDFSLNTAATGGALCRQSGIPGTFPGLSTVGYRAIGAVQPKFPTANIAQ